MLKKLSELITRYPLIFIGAWVGLFFLGLFGAVNVSDVYVETHYSEAGSTDSDFAKKIMEEEFGDLQTQIGNAFFIIYEGTNVTTETSYRDLLNDTALALFAVHGEEYTPVHYWSPNTGMDTSSFVSADNRSTYMMLIPLNGENSEEAAEITESVRNIVRDEAQNANIPTLKRYAVTGSPAAMSDSMEAAQESMEESDIFAMLTVTAVLLFIFGSLVGVGIPLAALVAVLITALGFLYYFGILDIIPVSEMVPNLISMLAIGICADYNLLLLSRFREEMNNGSDSAAAVRKSIQTAGKTVIFSGFTVMIGFGSLIVMGGPFANTIALAVLITVSLAILSVLTLSPAILTLIGHKLEWPSWLVNAVARLKRAGAKEGESFWARWSHIVQNRPWTFLLIGVIIILPLVAMAFQLKLGLPGVEFLPKGTESRTGYEMMEKHFSVGELSPVQAVLRSNSKATDSIFSQNIISGIQELAEWAVVQDEVASFSAPNVHFDAETYAITHNPGILNYSTFQAGRMGDAQVEINTMVHRLIQNTVDWSPMINGDNANNDTALIRILLKVGSGSSKSWSFIEALRDELDTIFPDVTHHVGGASASFLDQNDELWADFPLMITVCMVLTFIVLMILFRSILLPIKSIITIGCSVLLSYGVLVLVFQEGIGADLLGVEATGEGIIFFMPMFLFTAIFGLSMDYNVFILTRVKEEYDKTGDNTHAVAMGIEKTGSVVTSAALIMVATFGVFIFSNIVFMQMVGLALAVAVIVDATLIRTIILPSAMKLLGEWNWWLPEWLDRIIPKIDVDN
ncbi:MAG: MMPL family transporter [Candidatus Heimdallarchaeota archaeon]